MILHAINVNNITSTPGTYNFNPKKWMSTHTLAAPDGTATSEQLFQITFSGVTNNVSSPYLDYDSNQIFFGDSAGRIRRVINVDQKTASQDTTNFPVSCGTAQLRSPIFWNGQVVETSADGKLYRIDTTAATPYTCIAAQQGGAGVAGGAGGALSAPVLDVTNNTVIVGSNNTYMIGGRGYGAIDLMFTAGQAPGSFTPYGTTAPTIAPVEPAFDNAFWLNNNGSLVASGTNSAGSNTYLLNVPYNGGALGSVNGWAAFNHITSSANAVVATTPVTEFLTAAAEQCRLLLRRRAMARTTTT